MVIAISPQLHAVGEYNQSTKGKTDNPIPKQTYAARTIGNKSAASTSKIELRPVTFVHGEPTVEFTIDEVNEFTVEEGLHQAVIVKFSYGKPELHEFRNTFAKQFEIQGYCNIGQLEFRHILVRFDLFDDYVKFVSRSTGYVKSKGDEFFFRTFPWTIGFNPREETSKSIVWISFPDLPPNFFAKKSLMSIASSVGKPLAVDKATQDRTRPSVARVKVLLDLLDKHPQKVKIHIIDKVSGKHVEFHQMVVYDNLPKYCTCCKHQGHDEISCRLMQGRNREVNENNTVHIDSPAVVMNNVDQLKGDARDFLNAKRLAEGMVELTQNKTDSSKHNVVQIDGNITHSDNKAATGNNKPVHVWNSISNATVELQDDARRMLKNQAVIPASKVFERMHKDIDRNGDQIIAAGQKNSDGRIAPTGQSGKSANLKGASMNLVSKMDGKDAIQGVPKYSGIVYDSKGEDKAKEGDFWNVVTSRKSQKKKAASTGHLSPNAGQNAFADFSTLNAFEVLECNEARQVQITTQNDNNVSKQIVPADTNVNKARGSELETKEMGVTQNVAMTYFEEEMTGNSSNVPTLFFSTPHVENIIKEAQYAMMKHTNMMRQPVATLNTSDIDIPSQSEHSFEKYEGESTQLMLATELDCEKQGSYEHKWLARTTTWANQIEDEEDEDWGNDDERESTDYAEFESDDEGMRSVVSPSMASNQKSKLNLNAPAFIPNKSTTATVTPSRLQHQQLIPSSDVITASTPDAAGQKNQHCSKSSPGSQDHRKNAKQQQHPPNSQVTSAGQQHLHTTNSSAHTTGQQCQQRKRTPLNTSDGQQNQQICAGDSIDEKMQQHLTNNSSFKNEAAQVETGQTQLKLHQGSVVQQQQQRPVISIDDRLLLDALVNSNPMKCLTPAEDASTGREANRRELVQNTNSKQVQDTTVTTKIQDDLLVAQDFVQNLTQPVNVGRQIFEEGEEDDILQRRMIEAANEGDLSPMHSGKNRKSRAKKGWDGKANDETSVRRLPTRVAKQKQDASTMSTRSNRSRNK